MFRLPRAVFRAVPVLAPLVAIWCTGQALGLASLWSVPEGIVLIGAVAVMGVLLARSFLVIGWCSVLAVGFLTTATVGTQRSMFLPQENFVVFGEIDQEPRSPRVGERRVILRVRGVREGDSSLLARRILCTTHDLPWRNGSRLRSGDLAWFHGELRPLAFSGVGDLLWGYRGYLSRRGIDHQCRLIHVSLAVGNRDDRMDGLRADLKARVLSSLGPTERAGLVLSLLFGFRDTLSDDLERRLQSISLSHLLVVSGYQVSMMFVTLRLLVSTLMVGRARVAGECAALGAAWGYVALVGWEPSAVRAAVAMTVYVMSDLLGNRRSLPRSILLSLLIVTIIWPGCFFEMGVQLTFAALCGIAVSAVVFRGYSAVTQAICTPLVVTTTTMMVSLAWGYRSSLLGVALNPVVVPLVSLLGGPGAAAAVALTYTPVDPDGALLGVLADLLLYILVSIAELCDLPSEGLAMGLGTRGACGLGLCAMGALVLRRGYRRAVCVRGAM